MASNEKNFKVKLGVTTPKVDYTLDDKIITAEMLDLDTPTLSFSGSAGQLFSISDDFTGTIFSVNNISGIPSIEVEDTGKVTLAEFAGNVGVGTSNPQAKLDVNGAIRTNDGVYSSGDLILGANAAAVAYVKTSGEVGIGTDTPTHTLDVSGTARVTGNLTSNNLVISNGGTLGSATTTGSITISDEGSVSIMSNPASVSTPALTVQPGISGQAGITIITEDSTSNTARQALQFRDPQGNITFFINPDAGATYLETGSGQDLYLNRLNGGDVYFGGTTSYFDSPIQRLNISGSIFVGGSSVWHAGNLTPVTTTTNFGGDVSGTYNAIVIADDSHNHVISNVDGLQTALDGKVDENAAITAGTATKITYDAKGLVTAGTSLLAGDLPSHTHTKANITDFAHTHPVSEISNSTTVGQNVVTLANPSAVRFLRINSDNTVDALTDSDFRTAIGAGTSSTTGTVTSVSAGNGLSFTTITSSGSVTLGTPGTLTTGTTNAVTAGSHTHAVTFPVTGAGNGVTLSSGNIVLGTPGTITSASTNSVTASSHTHALTLSAADIGAAAASHTHTTTDITNLSSYTGFDARYYTESEITTLLAGYSSTSHNHTLDSLSNVTITSNSAGEIIKWNGSAWINNTLAEAGIAASSHTHTKSQITDFAHTHPSTDVTGLATVATSGAYSDLSGIPSTFTPASHTHGNITNAGAIGATADQVVTTTTSGVLTTSSRSGIDSRSTFPPTAHTHTEAEITDLGTYLENGDHWTLSGTDLYYSGGSVGIGVVDPTHTLEVVGSFAATTKSFVINHPTKPGNRLRYGSLEGPENGVYFRGKTKTNVIELPEYWTGLVHEDSITVQLTAIGKGQQLFVEDIRDNKIFLANGNSIRKGIHCFYFVQAERKDVERLEVEYGN